MSLVASTQPSTPPAIRDTGRGPRRLRGWPLWVLSLVALALIGGKEAQQALRSPGEAIRVELTAAAVELSATSDARPTDATLRAIRGKFDDNRVMLGTARWPQVSVTFPHLDRATCIDASRAAGRIEGLVVVELAGYRSAADCGNDNTMTWWISP